VRSARALATIQTVCRLVEQNIRWVVDHCARQREFHSLALGETLRPAVGDVMHMEQVEQQRNARSLDLGQDRFHPPRHVRHPGAAGR
jgi:hypothetical protein